MFDCRACAHSEIAHVNYVGCCVVAGCSCTGMDGNEGRCLRENHAADCNQLTERPKPALDTKLSRLLWRRGQPPLDAEVKARIVEMKRDGHGKRVIARALDLHPAVVQAYLQEVFGIGPAALPQTRATQKHREVVLAAGGTAVQWAAERGPGGRASSATAAEEWARELTSGQGS